MYSYFSFISQLAWYPISVSTLFRPRWWQNLMSDDNVLAATGRVVHLSHARNRYGWLSQYPLYVIPFKPSSFNVSQWNRLRGVWSTPVMWYNDLGDFSHTLPVLHATFRTPMCRKYWDSHQSSIRLQIRSGICAVLTADAVATGEINCYYCMVWLRPIPNFTETTSQGHNSVVALTYLINYCGWRFCTCAINVRWNANHLWYKHHGLFHNFPAVIVMKSCLTFT